MATEDIEARGKSGPGVSVVESRYTWTAVLLAAAWLPFVWRLARMWRSETEQWFGFGVPALVLFLLWKRKDEGTSADSRGGGGAGVLMAAGALLFAAALPVLEANPLWPTAAWLGMAGMLLLTVGAVAAVRGWRTAGKVAPVLVLMATALKWPAMIDVPVMSALMRINAAVAAEIVNLLGTPAVVHGNVIEVARGVIGVDEACSGLRSLQTVVMMALFLGEYDRLSWRRRVALVAGSVAAALGVNIARTTVLTWTFGNLGAEVEERWHDTAGMIALAVTLAGVWWLAEKLTATAAARENVRGPDARGVETRVMHGKRAAWRPVCTGLACVLVVETGTQLWYGLHERERGEGVQRVGWRLEAPDDSGWEVAGVPQRAAEILKFESGESFGRELVAPSRQVLAFAFRWSGDLARTGAPEAHNPLVCLPAVGAVKEQELPTARVAVGGAEIPFRFVRFRRGETMQHVWFCVWNPRTGNVEADGDDAGAIAVARLKRVLAGKRREERQQLIFFVEGERDDADAGRTLRDAVLTLVRQE